MPRRFVCAATTFVMQTIPATLSVVCGQVTFDLKHQLLSSLEWFKHRAAAAAAAGAPATSGVSNLDGSGFACIPQKALVADPVIDVRVAAWILETDNKKVISCAHHLDESEWH